jgi:hypothetical protein
MNEGFSRKSLDEFVLALDAPIPRFFFLFGGHETMSRRRALLSGRTNTSDTLVYDPANFTHWNERGVPCI